MELHLSDTDKQDIAVMTANIILSKMKPEQTKEELSTEDAMKETGYSTHQFFREYLKRNGISSCRKSGGVKYYYKDELLRKGNK